ncbi:MAG TPA: hypothetical protein VKY92_00930 [Verrucomicrobiae bacterium]|jgi:hypothetical protein|nr:hypothetical protein [Verrucomicrobiae bacterium]
MIKHNQHLFSILLAGTACLVSLGASAQYRPSGDDGITASPKVRQRLSERPVVYQTASHDPQLTTSFASDGIATSPKGRAKIEERKAMLAVMNSTATTTASTTRASDDGIAASPKLREQMRDHAIQRQIEIAPVKSAR